jgi:hypothetical protein
MSNNYTFDELLCSGIDENTSDDTKNLCSIMELGKLAKEINENKTITTTKKVKLPDLNKIKIKYNKLSLERNVDNMDYLYKTIKFADKTYNIVSFSEISQDYYNVMNLKNFYEGKTLQNLNFGFQYYFLYDEEFIRYYNYNIYYTLKTMTNENVNIFEFFDDQHCLGIFSFKKLFDNRIFFNINGQITNPLYLNKPFKNYHNVTNIKNITYDDNLFFLFDGVIKNDGYNDRMFLFLLKYNYDDNKFIFSIGKYIDNLGKNKLYDTNADYQSNIEIFREYEFHEFIPFDTRTRSIINYILNILEFNKVNEYYYFIYFNSIFIIKDIFSNKEYIYKNIFSEEISTIPYQEFTTGELSNDKHYYKISYDGKYYYFYIKNLRLKYLNCVVSESLDDFKLLYLPTILANRAPKLIENISDNFIYTVYKNLLLISNNNNINLYKIKIITENGKKYGNKILLNNNLYQGNDIKDIKVSDDGKYLVIQDGSNFNRIKFS